MAAHPAADPAELQRVRALTEAGDDVGLLFLAVEHGRLGPLRALLAGARGGGGGGGAQGAGKVRRLLHATDAGGATALSRACAAGRIDVVRALLAAGSPLLQWDGVSPVDALRASPAATDEPFTTLLLQSVCVGDAGRVDALCKAGVPAGSHDVVCWAAEQGQADVLRTLVDHGASVNTRRDSDGKTPLHLAVGAGHADLALALVDRLGADKSLADQNGVTGAQLADEMGVLLVAAAVSGAAAGVGVVGEAAAPALAVGLAGEAGPAAGAPASTPSPLMAQENELLRTSCERLEKELEEQRELVAGLRDMLNTVLVENGCQQLVAHLQGELSRVKEEAKLLAEASFGRLGRRDRGRAQHLQRRAGTAVPPLGRSDEHKAAMVERMCAAHVDTGAGSSGSRRGGGGGGGGGGFNEPQTLFELIVSLLGLVEEEDEAEWDDRLDDTLGMGRPELV